MPHYSGSASSFADLLTALRNACIAEGYTLSGSVLHKGTLFVDTFVGANPESGGTANSVLYVHVGNGIDGSNQLTDAAPIGPVGMGLLRDPSPATTYTDWDWPVAYDIHIHTAPDEVCMFVNYHASQFFQNVMFGQSPAPGNAGTGNWQSGTLPSLGSNSTPRRMDNVGWHPDGGKAGYHSTGSAAMNPCPFWVTTRVNSFNSTETRINSCMHGAIDSVTGLPIWTDSYGGLEFGGSNEGLADAACPQRPLVSLTPNAWNNEALLFPVQVLQKRPELKTSLIGELKHVRVLRINFIAPGYVIEDLLPDRWKVYPVYRKNASAAEPVGGADHSGTGGIAVRYDGV